MAPLTPVEYYRHPAVRDRIREYCGGGPGREPTCEFVATLLPGGYPRWETARRFPATALDHVLEMGGDVSRSLLDATSLLVHVDLEYVNRDDPGDALLRPAHAFFRLEPLVRAVSAELRRLHLPLLDLMTGRGYHFTGRIPIESPIVDRFANVGVAAATRFDPDNHPKDSSQPIDQRRDRAVVGLGMVVEYLAHRLVRHAAPKSAIPVVLNGTEVGRGGIGREALSIDVSYAGDVPEVRQVRVAFGIYQSHHLRPDLFGARAAALAPPLPVLPRRDRPVFWMLEHARTLDQAVALADSESAVLPDVTDGLAALVDEYGASDLARFHHDFYAYAPYPVWAWPDTYDRIDVQAFVPCVASPLVRPNDALLKPTALQHVTRALLSKGWHPRHIAGLVFSKYARDFGWGERWTALDPLRRADFDVRVFAGLVATGLDRGIDFNCVSSQEKGLCPRTNCHHDLRVDRDRLLAEVAM